MDIAFGAVSVDQRKMDLERTEWEKRMILEMKERENGELPCFVWVIGLLMVFGFGFIALDAAGNLKLNEGKNENELCETTLESSPS
jgi:hypothetical protein